MQSLVICSSSADIEAARDIHSYLEANCPSIHLHETIVIPSPHEVLETVDFALSCDICLLLLSPDSIPRAWPRQQWEQVLVEQPRELGSSLGFVLVRPCGFPQVLQKAKFFDLSVDLKSGRRKLRRWLVEQMPLKLDRVDVLPPRPSVSDQGGMDAELEDRVLDQPGICRDIPRETALNFAYAHSRDFEGVFWLDCRERERTGVIGDIGHTLGLKLLGPATENAAALREFCERPRCLFVFDALADKDREVAAFGGRASVIFTKLSEDPAPRLTLTETLNLFARWRTNPEECLRHLRDADRYLRSSPADSAKLLGTYTFNLLRDNERLAEAYEVVEILSKQAWEEGSDTDLRRWEWEKSWIRESWGKAASVPLRLGTTPEPLQMDLGL
jgi:hypothetical protein